MKRLIKIIFSHILFYSGVLPGLLHRQRKSPKIFIFMYHNLSENGKSGLSFSVFRKQILFLRRYFDIKSLEDAALLIKNKSYFRRNIAVITFDDGCKSFFKLAYQFLVENRIPATVFLVTDCAEGRNFIWTDKIRLLIDKADSKEVDMQLNSRLERLNLAGSKNKEAATNRIKKMLKDLPDSQREKKVTLLAEALNVKIDKRVDEFMLTWPLIGKLDKGLISFGAHTVTHPILAKVALKRATEEIVNSKNRIEENIRKPVLTFCYPNGEEGDFNSNIEEIVKKNNFLCACSAIEGVNTIDSNLFALKRISTSERHLPVFTAKLFFKYIRQ